jgi:hypothetical protein
MQESIKVASGLQSFDDKGGVAFGGKILKASEGGSTEWAKEEQIAYLEAFRENASALGVDTLQYLTGEDG